MMMNSTLSVVGLGALIAFGCSSSTGSGNPANGGTGATGAAGATGATGGKGTTGEGGAAAGGTIFQPGGNGPIIIGEAGSAGMTNVSADGGLDALRKSACAGDTA